MGGGAAPAGGAAEGAAEEKKEEEVKEKTHFDIELAKFDAASKIKLIKEVRAMLGLGLKEAKEMASAIKNFFTRKSLELPGKSFSL